ncbi:hypothetical protein MRB53_030548 [Persea americana]|uniref:Uncharacterized protein n=1 Tax=Persea americana TaxID=3435 RepID=A0ACC2KM33_PERAE|nr:hypothetical protein MRB53_030548 [Persea americana]
MSRKSSTLLTVCSPVDDEDIIIYTLNGLPPEYGPFRTSIRTRSAPILLEELHVLLQCEELNLDITQTSSTDILTTAMVASKEANKSGTPLNNRGGKSNFHGRGRGPKNNNRGRGNPIQPSNPKPCCQICNRTGHTALDCYHRMDYSYQGRHPPSQLAAMAASFNQNNDQQWYADSGATSHITNDLNNLSLQSGYQGKDQVTVGNGQGSHNREDSFPRIK